MNRDLGTAVLEQFISCVWDMGAAHARPGLPWRYLDDPYAVYVSEVMLQQTQVARVLKYWPRWMERFPTIDALSAASNSDVLEFWQGLGYNRRALALKRSADICASEYGGILPKTCDGLLALPGIGPATAAGIVAFAYQKPSIYLETNVRAVYLHHFFSGRNDKIADRELVPLLEATCPADRPREWYYALLDYGAHLKSTGENPTRKAAAYHRQSRFEGSMRQKRAFLLREVLASPGIAERELYELLCAAEKEAGRAAPSYETYESLLDQLQGEGFFARADSGLFP